VAGMYNSIYRWLLITLLSLVILLPGCKGKEEQQAVSTVEKQASTVEQRERVEPSPVPPSQPRVPESVPAEVTADTPPQITSIKITPEIPVIGDQIKALVETYDKEGDPVMLTFHWSINGAESASTRDTLSEGFKRGDRISLAVIPDDGRRTGNPKSLTIIVGNSLPAIQPLQPSSQIFSSGVYSYQVKASDPDGDAMTYSLKAGPEGMTVDPATGLVKWNVPHGWVGSFPYVVSVTDGHGGEASQNLSVILTPHK
jgi:hypothetical protein